MSDDVKSKISDLQDSFLVNEISAEDVYSQLSSIIDVSNGWYDILKTKPVHKNLLLVLNEKITDPTEVAKIVSSMVTQLIIRKIADPDLDYNLVRLSDWINILSDYSNTLTIDLSRVKSLIQDFETLGLIREEIE